MPGEMSAADYATLWPQLAQLSPEKVIVTGGEPLMRGDLLPLLAALREADQVRRMTVCLNTNGSLVTPSMARQLREFVDEVRVSVDGTESVHDALRGAGSLRAALDALSCFAVAGFVPRAVITATRTSLSCLDQTLLLLLRHGVTNIRLARFHPMGRRWPPALRPWTRREKRSGQRGARSIRQAKRPRTHPRRRRLVIAGPGAISVFSRTAKCIPATCWRGPNSDAATCVTRGWGRSAVQTDFWQGCKPRISLGWPGKPLAWERFSDREPV